MLLVESLVGVLRLLDVAYAEFGRRAGHEMRGPWLRLLKEAFEVASAKWMKDSTQEQMDKLRALLVDSPLKFVQT